MKYRIQQINAEQLQKLRAVFCASRPDAVDTQPADTGIEQAESCFAAQSDDSTIGAVWAWNLDKPGIDTAEETEEQFPAVYVYVLPEYRGCGIGTDLVKTITDYLALCGYPELYGTVRRDNYAVLLFGSVGFRPVREVEQVYTLWLDLKSVGQIEM